MSIFKKYLKRFPKDLLTKGFWKNVFNNNLFRFILVLLVSGVFMWYSVQENLMIMGALTIGWLILNLAQIYDTYHDNKYPNK